MIIIKAVNIKNPGIRGGQYWVDKHGNIQYGEKGMDRLRKVSEAGADYFTDNIRYYVGMAKNIANKLNVGVEYYDGQPIGTFADMLAAGRMACIKTYNDNIKRKINKNELKIIMNKRISGAMWGVGIKLQSQVNLSYYDLRHRRVIDKFKDKYYKIHGNYPDAETIANNIKLKYNKTGEMYDAKKTLEIVNRIETNKANTIEPIDDNVSSSDDIQLNSDIPQIERLMIPIKKLQKQGKIKNVDYQIIQMYLGIGKYKTPQTLDEISKKLGKDRRYASNRISLIKPILKPYFEKYRSLLEKSMTSEDQHILDFIRLILE